jgi:hypothetical protein
MGFGKKKVAAVVVEKVLQLPPPLEPFQLGCAGLLALGGVACLYLALVRPPPSKATAAKDPRFLSAAAGWRLASAAAFALNVAVVSWPGRYDGDVKVSADGSAQFEWDSLFTPAPYAFAIWGAIYLGEAAGVFFPLVRGREVRSFAKLARRGAFLRQKLLLQAPFRLR